MPTIVDPNNSQGFTEQEEEGKLQDLHGAEYEYDYPRDFDLKPGSEFHEKLLRRIMQRANDSNRVMSRRHKDWQDIDRIMRTYVPPEQVEESGDESKKTKTSPEIVIPQTYATYETILTYMTGAFLQNPIWNYEGVGPEDVMGATLMTHLIDQQASRSGMGLQLHTQWGDSLKYGIGVVSPVWERKFGTRTYVEEKGFAERMQDLFIVTDRKKKTEKNALISEGNRLINIDPYSYLPDPNVSAHEVQDAEFVGWVEKTNKLKVLSRDKDKNDYVFNAKYLRHIEGRSSIITLNTRMKNKRDESDDEWIVSNNPCHVIWMYIDIIPSDWGLGRSQYPETWFFGVAGDNVIITAKPLGLNHGKKPIAVCAPDYDGYSANPISRLGVISDIQNLIDFLYSSHIQNVRKAINDMFVIDPSVINYHDVANPEPGKLIRMRRRAWGKGQLDQAIKQFNVQDVTQGHVADTQFLTDVMQQVSSANDFLKGSMPQRTSRVSAAEVNRLSGSGMSRLEKMARIISMQSMQPIGDMMASHVQQLMEQDTYVKLTGELESQLREELGIEEGQDRVAVNPLDMIANYDVKAHDGTVPGSEDPQTWIQLYQIAAQNPIVSQNLDFTRIFKHIARQMGAKNVDDFVQKAQGASPQVQPDETVDQQVQKGNLVPMNGQ